MFTNAENEIISGSWALSAPHSRSWLVMVAKILQSVDQKQFHDFTAKESKIDASRYVVDPEGLPVTARTHSETPEGSIGVIRIAGPMVKYGTWFLWGTDELITFAEQFDNDPAIIGQIWLIDTGGGSVSAIAPYIEFLKNKKKPVIGLADICGSAGYYVFSALDKCYARNKISAMFGSIGTMATIYDYREYFKSLGIEERIIYADQSDHKNRSYHKALDGDDDDFKKEHLNPLAQDFQDHVRSMRPNLKTDIEGILNGKMFYAGQAMEYGLIDGIMDFPQAVEQIKTLAAARQFMY